MNKPRVCLNMIVKNEAHVIRRCLDSVRPLIDTWCIVDTGSTDGTQDVIREHFRDIPGTLHERPWQGFGRSRTEAIELARPTAEYLFFIDADDQMFVPPGFRMPALTEDIYEVEIHHDSVVHWRHAIVATRLPWRYEGVLHEYLECDVPYKSGRLKGTHMVITGGGARSQVDFRTKFLRDAETLEQALREEPDNRRYVFYLAQSYRDAGELDKSIAAYERRATMDGFEEEVFYSLYQAAKIAVVAGRPPSEVIDRHLRAYERRPTRAEPLGELARWFREKGNRWPLAYLFAQRAVKIPMPADVLFVEPGWYQWRALDELGVAAYWVGEHRESLECCQRLLSGKFLPQEHRARVQENLGFAKKALGIA